MMNDETVMLKNDPVSLRIWPCGGCFEQGSFLWDDRAKQESMHSQAVFDDDDGSVVKTHSQVAGHHKTTFPFVTQQNLAKKNSSS